MAHKRNESSGNGFRKHRWGYFRILPFVIIEEIIEIVTYRDKECTEDISYMHIKTISCILWRTGIM